MNRIISNLWPPFNLRRAPILNKGFRRVGILFYFFLIYSPWNILLFERGCLFSEWNDVRETNEELKIVSRIQDAP